jgi:type II secretory pathway component PulC
MKNLHLFIYNYARANGRMPTIEEIAVVLRKEAPQTDQLLREGVIRLTGIRQREGIWAYTFEPQTGNQHFVLTQSGIERMTTEDLRQRLQQQQGQ